MRKRKRESDCEAYSGKGKLSGRCTYIEGTFTFSFSTEMNKERKRERAENDFRFSFS